MLGLQDVYLGRTNCILTDGMYICFGVFYIPSKIIFGHFSEKTTLFSNPSLRPLAKLWFHIERNVEKLELFDVLSVFSSE